MTATEKEEALIEVPYKRRGLIILNYCMLLTLVIMAGRVFYLDFFKGQYYAQISKDNRIRSVAIKAPRGNIVDKHGKVLARNAPSIDAIIVPSNLPEGIADRRKIADMTSEILGMNSGNIEAIIESQDRKSPEPILLHENISQDQALILSEKAGELPGITIDRTAIRSYENSVIFSPIIGYDGKITRQELSQNNDYLMTDYIGKSGLEKSYEKELRGVYGARQVEIDSRGNIKKNLGVVNPKAGSDLVLNIDEGLQKRLYDSLSGVLETTETKTAAAVAIDPRNGGVLAMVSLPGYDNNLFAKGISNEDYKNIVNNKDLPLLNRVVAGEYPPGSTLKPAVAAAALTEGTIAPDTMVNDSGGAIFVGSWRFGDWKTHGAVNVKKAIAESCDVFFYTVGGGYGNVQGLGMDKMKKYENMFGFGEVTGIDLAGESNGFIPSESWKLEKKGERWYIGDSYHSAIGQGFITVTPLQLANYTATIANGGSLYVPRIVNRINEKQGVEKIITPSIIKSNFIPQNVMDVVREGMRMTVTEGTAQTLKDLPVAVAGKTGTAQFGSENKTHAWFISFAPFDNPTIAMAVLVEGGGEGHSSAVPVTRDVYQWYFEQAKN